MGTSLDIKIKRANKVYHAGVSGGAGGASGAGGGAQARAVALGPRSRCGRALRTGQVGFGPGSLLMQTSAPKPAVTSGVATLERPAETRAIVIPGWRLHAVRCAAWPCRKQGGAEQGNIPVNSIFNGC